MRPDRQAATSLTGLRRVVLASLLLALCPSAVVVSFEAPQLNTTAADEQTVPDPARAAPGRAGAARGLTVFADRVAVAPLDGTGEHGVVDLGLTATVPLGRLGTRSRMGVVLPLRYTAHDVAGETAHDVGVGIATIVRTERVGAVAFALRGTLLDLGGDAMSGGVTASAVVATPIDERWRAVWGALYIPETTPWFPVPLLGAQRIVGERWSFELILPMQLRITGLVGLATRLSLSAAIAPDPSGTGDRSELVRFFEIGGAAARRLGPRLSVGFEARWARPLPDTTRVDSAADRSGDPLATVGTTLTVATDRERPARPERTRAASR